MLPGCDAELESQTKQIKRRKRADTHGRQVPAQSVPATFSLPHRKVPRIHRTVERSQRQERLSSDVVIWALAISCKSRSLCESVSLFGGKKKKERERETGMKMVAVLLLYEVIRSSKVDPRFDNTLQTWCRYVLGGGFDEQWLKCLCSGSPQPSLHLNSFTYFLCPLSL